MERINGTQMTGSTGSAGTWVSVKEYALMKGVSERAIRKNIAAGKYQVKEVPHPSRADQVSYMVLSETAEPECGTKSAELRNCGTAEPKVRNCGTAELRNQSAEPECGTKSAEPEATTDNLTTDGFDIENRLKPAERPAEASDTDTTDGVDIENRLKPVERPAEASDTDATDATDATAGITEKSGSIEKAGSASCSTCSTGIDYVPYHKMDEAQLYALLMQEIDSRLHRCDSKLEEWKAITADFNSRNLVPELRALKGKRSERGLRHWYQKWQESDQDMFELVHKNNANLRGRKVTYLEQQFLIGALLCGHEKPIMNAIREMKVKAIQGVIESPSSVPTLKRWCKDYATDNPAIWTQARRGDKAVKDEIVKSVDRDDSSIEPLQVFVVDGHKLSLFVTHPITGKPFRPTLIMVFDWGSRYPVGMSLALTEDSAHTLAAVRNSMLHSGVIPPFFYLDNGKAFRSKLFNAKWEEHDLEKEFAGIFPKLGIDAHFARSYNARAKVVERFFKTMQDQWETRQASYCGTAIKNKPAHMARNETWMQEMYGSKAMDYNECMNGIYEWIRWEYGMSVHQTIKAKPYEVFTNAVRNPDRLVNPVELNFLMLTAERKRLREDGIILYKNRYWDPELVNHIGKPVIIRYDYADLRSILVYDMQSRYICQADMRESQCAWVFAEKDNPLAAQRLWAEDREISALQRRIRRDTKRVVTVATRAVEAEVAKHQHIIDERKTAIDEHNPAFKQAPMIPAPKARREIQDEILDLESIAMRASEESDNGVETAEIKDLTPKSKVINLEDLLAEDEGDLAGSVSFSEMQKIIGIER